MSNNTRKIKTVNIKDSLEIQNAKISFEDYFETNSISIDTQNKLNTTDILIVPQKYDEKEYYFSQESISFIKFCREQTQDFSIDLLADGDICTRSLHSFDILMPVIFVATEIIWPIVLNLVSSFIYDKLKGREKEDAKVDVTFMVKRDGEDKVIHYSGDAKTFKKAFKKIDITKL